MFLAGTFRRARRWLRRNTRRAARILMYHRVAVPETDPSLLCVAPEQFAEQMEVVRRRCAPLGLLELVERMQTGTVPRRAVAITFDDGYADNLLNAKPILERFAIPATVFVTAGALRQRREFWWDEIERLFLLPGELPATLRVDVGGSVHQWELGTAACYSAADHQRHRGWHLNVPCEPTPRQSLYRSIHRLLRPLSALERQHQLDLLLKWAGLTPGVRPARRQLTRAELVELAHGGLVEVGAHTITHPQLSLQPLETQIDEIRRGKDELEEVSGRQIQSFAYPFGTYSDYSTETITAVRDAGFRCACSAFPGLATRETDCFQLPRFMVLNWNGEEFSQQLHEFLE